MLRFDRKQQNSVKQLSFKKKKNKFKKKKERIMPSQIHISVQKSAYSASVWHVLTRGKPP